MCGCLAACASKQPRRLQYTDLIDRSINSFILSIGGVLAAAAGWLDQTDKTPPITYNGQDSSTTHHHISTDFTAHTSESEAEGASEQPPTAAGRETTMRASVSPPPQAWGAYLVVFRMLAVLLCGRGDACILPLGRGEGTQSMVDGTHPLWDRNRFMA